jgi:hypothetical protein
MTFGTREGSVLLALLAVTVGAFASRTDGWTQSGLFIAFALFAGIAVVLFLVGIRQ